MSEWTPEEGTTRPGLWWPAMEELIKENDSHKSVELGGDDHYTDVTTAERVDQDGDRRSETGESTQHLSVPI